MSPTSLFGVAEAKLLRRKMSGNYQVGSSLSDSNSFLSGLDHFTYQSGFEEILTGVQSFKTAQNPTLLKLSFNSSLAWDNKSLVNTGCL